MKSPELNTSDAVFDHMEQQLQQEVAQDLAAMEGRDYVSVEVDPLQALSTQITEKPGFGRGNLRNSETHRNNRFKRDRFKGEIDSDLKHEERSKALDEKKNNLHTRQNLGRTASAHLVRV